MSALCAGGIVRHGALCYTARRICAALRAAMTAKNFRTRAAAKRRGISFAPQKYFFMQSAQGIPTQGFQNHIPARGRKRYFLSCKNIWFDNFKTISPQGDGNNNYMRNNSLQEISKPYPRKGTETLIISPNHKTTYKNFKTISPQGDGNFSLITQSKPSPLYFKTISPQGDGNKVLDIVQSC